MWSLDLKGVWRFRGEDAYGVLPRRVHGISRWMRATVPGTVHTDLMAAGKIPDPFYRTNENDVQWVDGLQWIYRRSFDLPESVLNERTIDLVAEGLDTFASIMINDQPAGTTANMFVGHRFDVKTFLRAGRNIIEIRFDSPTFRAKAQEEEHGRLKVALEPHRVYARKAQYSFGWDWGPKLTTSGIWRAIRLEAYSGTRLKDPAVRVLSVASGRAQIELGVSLEQAHSGLTLEVFITGEGTAIRQSLMVEADRVAVRQTLSEPHLWWPNGYGAQHLYSAKFTLRSGEEILDTLSLPFAVRTVRLLQEPDEEGRSFVFEVNGTRIFCKGADWIPADSFLPRVSESTYQQLLTMARDASMNMIRVWGGGVYEQDVFYDLCDRLGLMVWQDFMFACAEYPDHPAFLEEVRREAEKVVLRLRNHPSIVLWCGNNECEWIFCAENPGKGPDDMHGASIFRDVLPAVVREYDGSRPYWRSTPFGEGFPNAQGNGNHHQWEVWSMWKDFRDYRQNRARFVSEFGFQAPPDQRTLERVMHPKDRTAQSPVMEHHNKQVEGSERLFRFQAGHYSLSSEWEDFFYRGQLVQAEALKCAVEHWRRRKFRTGGALFWQLNDCWPVTSWSVIDCDLRPKAAYYYARRFFAPVLITFSRSDSGLEVWGTNDFLEDVAGRLSLQLLSFTGTVIWHKDMGVRIPANASQLLHVLPEAPLQKANPATTYVHAGLYDRARPVAENRFFFREPKHLALPHAGLRFTIRKTGPGAFLATVRSKNLALGVALCRTKKNITFHDNFFDVDPGSAREIQVSSSLSLARLRRAVTSRSVNSRTRTR